MIVLESTLQLHPSKVRTLRPGVLGRRQTAVRVWLCFVVLFPPQGIQPRRKHTSTVSNFWVLPGQRNAEPPGSGRGGTSSKPPRPAAFAARFSPVRENPYFALPVSKFHCYAISTFMAA